MRASSAEGFARPLLSTQILTPYFSARLLQMYHLDPTRLAEGAPALHLATRKFCSKDRGHLSTAFASAPRLAECLLRSGRIEARFGLRMMPAGAFPFRCPA